MATGAIRSDRGANADHETANQPWAVAAPVFISYSRKDFYFAESLALHLIRERIPAWMDVRNLNPGVFWERDLFAALDAAACVIVIASRESMRSPNVHEEIERARNQNKRILVVRFRGVHLPDTLAQCEQVDFRGAFQSSLRELVAQLQTSAGGKVPSRRSSFLAVPLWVVAIVVVLAIPTLAFMALGDWGTSQDNWVILLLVPVFILALCWSVTISFLQRRMGMTRLAISLATLGGMFAFPLLLFHYSGAAGLKVESAKLQRATMQHWDAMFLLAALPLACLALIVALRPYDLLRWTPTGKAWDWYRQKCAARLGRVNTREAVRPNGNFFLVNDAMDTAAASRIRQQLADSGWQEVAVGSGGKAVLLLTNRTRTDWLLQQQPSLTTDVMTVVATGICLPAQLDWLWKREWVDFRSWKPAVLERREALPQVPEAVTEPRFPAPVRFANHLLCCLAALSFWLMAIANPAAMQDSQTNTPPAQVFGMVAGLAVVVLNIELARRLLRRSIDAAGFRRWSWVGWAGALILTLFAWGEGVAGSAMQHMLPAMLFIAIFPIALARSRKAMSFWFPATRLRKAEKTGTLATGRIWRTFWCVALYLMVWGWVLGMYRN